MERNILEENEKSLFIKYLVPSMLSMLAVSAYSFVDTFVVGHAIGSAAVAAMGLGTPIVSILYAIGFLFGAGGAVNYAVKMSTGKQEEARSIFSCSFWSAIIMWILVASLGNIFIRNLAVFLGATEGNIDLTVEYLHWIISLSGFLVMDLVLNNFMRNDGHPNVSMVATVTGTVLNIFLDFLFVMGFKWGMGGAASATCIASIVSVVINGGYAIAHKANLRPKFKVNVFSNAGSMINIGFGSFVLEGAVAVISVVFLNFAGKFYEDDGVSAFSVLITFNLVVYSLLNGVAQSIQPLVSANFGANKTDRIGKFLRYGLITSGIVGLSFFTVAEIMPERLVRLFIHDSDSVIQMAAGGLRYYAFAYIFMSVSIVIGIFFQAKTKALYSLLVLLGRSAAFPIVTLLVLAQPLKGLSLWISIPIGEGLAVVMAVVLLRKAAK